MKEPGDRDIHVVPVFKGEPVHEEKPTCWRYFRPVMIFTREIDGMTQRMSDEEAERRINAYEGLVAQLEVFENRRKLALSLKTEAPHVYAFVEAIAQAMKALAAAENGGGG